MLAAWQGYFADNPAVAAAALGIVSLAAFYVVAWYFYGRDPPHGVIVPLFEVPDELSPEAVRLVHTMRWDRKAFAAALINCAVKGFLRVDQKDDTYTLERTGKTAASCGLTAGETAMCDALFAEKRRTLELRSFNANIVQAAIDGLKEALFKESDRYYTDNDGLFWSGIGIFALTFIAAFWFSADPWGDLFDVVIVAIMIAMSVSLLIALWGMWRDLIRTPRVGRFFWAFFATLFVVPFSLVVLAMVHGLGLTISYAVFAPLLAGLVLIWLFRGLLKAPTRLGGVTRDKLDGLKLYLETAEKTRLEAITPEVFEKFLPYAMALDCETSWTRAFESHAVPDAPRTHYHPGWYVGTMMTLDALSLLPALGASLGSAAAAASVAPSTPSRGMSLGGSIASGLIGGFVGGGRGGGGGGGW